jgi:hypothetical protein
LLGSLEGKIPLGRSRRRWKINIKINLREIALEGADRIGVAQGGGWGGGPGGGVSTRSDRMQTPRVVGGSRQGSVLP